MTFVFVLAGIAVIAAVALLAVGRLGELPDVEPDRAPLALPDDRPLGREDVDSVRFAVGMRGYRMDEVDDVLDRLAAEVSERDATIAALESQLRGRDGATAAPQPAATETVPETAPGALPAVAVSAPAAPQTLEPPYEPYPATTASDPRPPVDED